MSFKSQAYRILIASPSDLAEERQVQPKRSTTLSCLLTFCTRGNTLLAWAIARRR